MTVDVLEGDRDGKIVQKVHDGQQNVRVGPCVDGWWVFSLAEELMKSGDNTFVVAKQLDSSRGWRDFHIVIREEGIDECEQR